ncbi:sugar transferase [Enterococcus faecium]|uniref:sugar transferase n=1 Tax=Enterococcus faecium TaxID=1352 RepID=UPI000DEB60A3|nr:sugar transferase [Enterococcus faecium]EME3491131.1 sugar transferase [Enterococcus faecium]EME3596727.1 sugar transferase [Enterococcus faecium]EME8208948.1 sugar transferase [Enterococcus faecium]EMF0493679.1 sugar transferase [Enterococcus faecium]EMF0581444.1 sugar transferase [Enterococcus faecium]
MLNNKMTPAGSIGYRFIKRSFDIVCSTILLIPVGIVIGFSSIFIKKEDHGPIFYMANRTGRYGKTFKMIKLRSMKVNAPDIRLADGSTYNGDDDPRVTKFGKFARKTSIDELPQIINIFKGDMTFIGPRPDTPVGSAAYTDEEKIILRVRPGVTGYNQAVNRNSVLTKEKLKNDIYYVKHISLWFDIKIVFMTIVTVLGHKNVNRIDATTDNTYVLNEDGSKTENISEVK